MNYWWTAEYHFSHFNIIRYCDRPFKTAEEMNKVLSVEVWNYYPVSFKEITAAVSAFVKEEKKTKSEPMGTQRGQTGANGVAKT